MRRCLPEDTIQRTRSSGNQQTDRRWHITDEVVTSLRLIDRYIYSLTRLGTSARVRLTRTRRIFAMSVLIRFAPASLTAQQYDESVRRLERGGDWPPDGLDYHVCFGSDGNLRVSEIWD